MQYETTVLHRPNLQIERCNVLNPASLLPTEVGGDPHDCTAVVQVVCTVRLDLKDQPLENPDSTLFVDGSAYRGQDGSGHAGYAVCSDKAIKEAASLPSHYSAQQAELCALIRACEFSAGQTVNIYTDSNYAFGVVHDKGAIWKMRGFLTSAGTPIKNGSLISKLLASIMLSKAIAVIKCRAHQKFTTDVDKGNDKADKAAKAAAEQPIPLEMPARIANQQIKLHQYSLSDIIGIQAAAPINDHDKWQAKGGMMDEDGLWTNNGKVVAPVEILPCLHAWLI